MYYELMNSGDRILTITTDFLAIERADGSVEFYPISVKNNKVHFCIENTTVVGYTPDDISGEEDDYIVTDNGVHVVNF